MTIKATKPVASYLAKKYLTALSTGSALATTCIFSCKNSSNCVVASMLLKLLKGIEDFQVELRI